MACEDVTAANDALIAALTGPLKVSGDAGSVEQRSVSELIQAANYLAGVCAARSGNGARGLRFSRMIPDGTVDGCRGRGSFNRGPFG